MGLPTNQRPGFGLAVGTRQEYREARRLSEADSKPIKTAPIRQQYALML
jgi:hypothetical protein